MLANPKAWWASGFGYDRGRAQQTRSGDPAETLRIFQLGVFFRQLETGMSKVVAPRISPSGRDQPSDVCKPNAR